MNRQKLDKKNYNTTDLNPERSFERHVFHRDQFAHYLRWSHIIKELKKGETVCDFGCGSGNLLEVIYRNCLFRKNKDEVTNYIGIDIRDKFKEKLKELDWAKFIVEDLVNPQNNTDFKSIKADRVVSFEVLEHVGKQNADKFMKNFLDCGKPDALFYISTPNYDEKVGAANNHTYDSGDGRGIAIQEFSYNELKELFSKHAVIVDTFGTFASVRDYKPFMNEWQKNMFDELKKYHMPCLVANLMAPFFPEQSRNTLWKLKKKNNGSLF